MRLGAAFDRSGVLGSSGSRRSVEAEGAAHHALVALHGEALEVELQAVEAAEFGAVAGAAGAAVLALGERGAGAEALGLLGADVDAAGEGADFGEKRREPRRRRRRRPR